MLSEALENRTEHERPEGPRCGRPPSSVVGEINGTVKKAGKTVAYPVVPSLFPQHQSATHGPSKVHLPLN